MILLQAGTEGNVSIFTLNENTTISGTSGVDIFYLFEFTNTDTNTPKYFLGTDTSSNKVRYNQYNIELVTLANEDLTNSKVNLESGRYKYNVYQQNSSTNLDPTLADGIVEKGFSSVDIEIINVVYNDQSNENITYNG